MFGVGIKFIDRVISKVRRFEKKYILEKWVETKNEARFLNESSFRYDIFNSSPTWSKSIDTYRHPAWYQYHFNVRFLKIKGKKILEYWYPP